MDSLVDTIKKKIMLEFQRKYITATVPAPEIIKRPAIQLENFLFGHDLDQIKIEKPIFIIGCHRSGTTILYDTMAQHPNLAYFTNASAFLPNIPILSHKVSQMLGLGEVSQERFIQDGIDYSSSTPSEGIRIWEQFAPPKGEQDLNETYDNPVMEQYLKETIKKHLKYFNCSRFLNKNPDNSTRMRYINKLFPDAYFIHIVRDGRAVCSSIIKARQKAVDFFGSEHPHAKHGTHINGSDGSTIDWDASPVKSAGVIWREVTSIIERDKPLIDPNRFMEFRFEDFVTQPFEYYEKIMNFCELDWSDSVQAIFKKEAEKVSLGNRNDSWKKMFSPDDLAQLMEIIQPTMQFYGYDV